VSQGSSLFDSRSNCEPTQSAWESISALPLVGLAVDTHLFTQVLRPSDTGRLEPFFAPRPLVDGGLA
jgi:hypothetical protein